MKMKKVIAPVLLLTLSASVLAGCGGNVSYKDGTYTAQSSVHEGDEDGNGDGYGVVTITIQDGVITDAEFLTYEPDGTLKDEEYGKQQGEVANADFYNKAQRAVEGSKKYAGMLVEAGSPDKVDAITGATISYNEFQEAVKEALKQARE